MQELEDLRQLLAVSEDREAAPAPPANPLGSSARGGGREGWKTTARRTSEHSQGGGYYRRVILCWTSTSTVRRTHTSIAFSYGSEFEVLLFQASKLSIPQTKIPTGAIIENHSKAKKVPFTGMVKISLIISMRNQLPAI